MVSTKTKIIGLFALVFALGAVAGGGVSFAFAQRERASTVIDEATEGRDARRIAMLTREVGISPAQGAKVAEVLARHRATRNQLARDMFQRCGEKVSAEKAATDAEIRALLHPVQQERFDELLKRRKEAWASPPGSAEPRAPVPEP
jgi:hypothetical protein